MSGQEGLTVETNGPEETERIGARLVSLLPTGAVVALRGDLATGKTCLVRGMANAVAPDAPIHSPTFTLVNRYGAPRPLYHLDLYRLGGPEDLVELGYEELFDSDGICVVEWAERAEGILPAATVDIALEHGGGDRRILRIANHGVLPDGWQAALTP